MHRKTMKKIALVTGGTSGIGLNTVIDLTQDGYEVYSISKSSKNIESAQDKCPQAEFLRGDISDINSIEKIADYILAKDEKIDVLVNNAGIIHTGGIEQISFSELDEMYKVNVYGVFNCIKIMLPLLKKSDQASIINVSSISSQITGSSMVYSACKASVDMMTKSLAKELAQYKIRVNSVNPGLIDTGFQIHNNLMDTNQYEELIENANTTYPLGTGSSQDIADLICFLASDKAKWITGSNYVIDGGRSASV